MLAHVQLAGDVVVSFFVFRSDDINNDGRVDLAMLANNFRKVSTSRSSCYADKLLQSAN